MATFDATTHPLAFAHMEGGVKTVYAVPRTAGYGDVCAGDRVEFADLGSITVGAVRKYGTVEELLEKEGFANVVPEATDLRHAVDLLRATDDWDDRVVAERGVLALRVRSARRKT